MTHFASLGVPLDASVLSGLFLSRLCLAAISVVRTRLFMHGATEPWRTELLQWRTYGAIGERSIKKNLSTCLESAAFVSRAAAKRTSIHKNGTCVRGRILWKLRPDLRAQTATYLPRHLACEFRTAAIAMTTRSRPLANTFRTTGFTRCYLESADV